MVMIELLTVLMKHVNMLIHDDPVEDAPFHSVNGRSRGSGEDPHRTWCGCQ